MIDPERAGAFIRSLERQESEICAGIREEAVADGVPVIRQETADLLPLLVRLTGARHILEIGTAVGYSALRMREAAGEGVRIDTIENYLPRIEKAKENFRLAGTGESIRLLEGDAADILPGLSGPYDLIFMDAAKGQYPVFLPHVLRLLAVGGVLFSDNVLQEGEILESRFAVARRSRTIHGRMREYLYSLTHTEGLETAIVPTGDGAAVTVRTAAWEGETDEKA